MNVLEVHGARKRYGSVEALRGISCTIPQGYVVGLVGPNGAGKTTLIKAILNLVRLDEGAIEAFGLDHARCEREVRRRIGFVHESSYLFDELTARQHARVFAAAYPSWDRQRYDGYLDRFSLPPTSRVKTYSKGMKMRLALAAALSHEAQLIVMDEPASGLDPIVRRELLTVIAEELEQEERSFLISTHITSDLDRIADYILILDRGELILAESREAIGDSFAVCKGGHDLLENGIGAHLHGTVRTSVGFTGLTADRGLVAGRYGQRVTLERPTIEDLVVYLVEGGTR